MKRGPRKNSFQSVACRETVTASRPCPINSNAKIRMSRAAVIVACKSHNDRRTGPSAGKRGPCICDACETGAAIRAGKKRFKLPTGITLYTVAELDRLKSTLMGATL